MPLKGHRTFIASGYQLIKEDVELASTDFPDRGSKVPFQINWKEKVIKFSKDGNKTDVYLDDIKVGKFYPKKDMKKEDVIEVNNELPVELQVFCYFAYKKYSEVSLGI